MPHDPGCVDEAVRGRRTLKKGYEPEPVPRAVLEELFALARWAPNHRLNQPWRFRVLGAETIAGLKAICGKDAAKLDRAPTLVVVSAVLSEPELHAQEDLMAASCAAYITMLAAHARGYASYWRTPKPLKTREARQLCGVGDDEHVLGLLHFGRPAGRLPEPPEREPVHAVASFLP